MSAPAGRGDLWIRGYVQQSAATASVSSGREVADPDS